MLTPSTLRFRLPPLFALLLVLSACDSGEGSSLYDPDAGTGPAPVISSVGPEGVVLAGIDVVTIEGQNFSDDPALVRVVFDDQQGASAAGEILSATPTRLEVQVPNLPNPALRVRVAVVGAQAYSNAVSLPLTSAVTPFGDLDSGPGVREEPAAIIGDGSGALYVSLSANGSAGGILRLSQDGIREPFADSRVLWNDLSLGGPSDDRLFATQSVQAIFELPAGRPVPPVLPNNRIRLTDVTADASGVIWAGGAAGTPTNPITESLYRFDLDGGVTETVFPGTVADLRAFDGFLYVAATRSGDTPEAKVWRLPIQADGTLGDPEVVYDVEADQPGRRPSALALAADGTVFVGIAPPASDPRAEVEFPVIRVSPDGTAAPLYPGVLPSPVSELAWGAGSELYLVQSRIPPPAGETGEPSPALLFRVETRLQGAP